MAPHIRHWLAATLVALPGLVLAVELETIGPVYPIGEKHLLDFIHQRLLEKEKSGELLKLEKQARDRGIDSVLRPEPVAGVKAAETARTFYFDPSFTLAQNVLDAQGKLLFAAGVRKNPLEVIRLSKHLLFFDGRDQRQVQRARTLIEFYGGRVKPILVGGSYIDLMKAWRTPVFFDQQGRLTRRLGITNVPAIVSQEGLRLRIDELALP